MDRADAHSFIGIMVPRQQATELGRLQTALRSTDGRFEPIERRWLNLTLDDLGPVDPAALEAAALACARVVAAHSPFALRSGGLRQLGSVVALMIDDPQDRLSRLRAALHAQLDGFGFTLDPRPFAPHIALGRGAPTLDITAPTLSFKIHTLRLLTHVPPSVPGLPWRVRFKGDLTPVVEAAPAAPAADRDAEIRAELEARVITRAAERVALRERQARAPKPEPTRARRGRGDRAPPDRPPRDRSRDRAPRDGAEDRPQQERPQQERPQQERPQQGRRRQDRPQNQRPRRDRPDRPRKPDGPPDERADANAPRPKRRRRRRRSGGRSTPQPPKESS